MLEFINREDFNEKSLEDIRKEFQGIVDGYENDIKDMSIEQLREEEKRLIDIMEKWDKQVSEISYDLPKSFTFEGSNREVTRKTVGGFICELLEKVECEFSYTLGYYELWKLWKNPPSTINYRQLNSTLQVLGSGMKFRGPHQWELILSINEYFKPLHNTYQKDNFITILYGTCHSKLIDLLEMNDPEKANKHNEIEAEQSEVLVEDPVG